MTIAAVAALAATAVVGIALWYAVDRRRERISVTAAVLAAAAPAALLGVAALLALGDSGAGDGITRTAHAVAVVAAIPGGGLVATAVLRLADRGPRPTHTGLEKPPADSPASAGVTAGSLVPPPPPPPSPAPHMAPWTPRSALDAPAEGRPGSEADQPRGSAQVEARKSVSNPETLRGGAAIGSLERVAVVVSLLAGWPEGLALTLAIKGFGRYPELRKPSAPERFIVGTFASILWATAVAGVVVALRT